MYIFFDRTNVRSNLLLLGHLPNLVGHCPMSDSNLQPCIRPIQQDLPLGEDSPSAVTHKEECRNCHDMVDLISLRDHYKHCKTKDEGLFFMLSLYKCSDIIIHPLL